jgi:hypothetical protein
MTGAGWSTISRGARASTRGRRRRASMGVGGRNGGVAERKEELK